MKIITILIFLVILILIAHIPIYLIYGMAKEICGETEIRPIRYVYVGLFGVKNQIETTPENADAYGKVCISHGDPRFYSVTENINYLLSQST